MKRNLSIICHSCGRELSKDEKGLNQKLLEHLTKKNIFQCITCLAEYLECGVDDLNEKIDEFKAEGCKLFG